MARCSGGAKRAEMMRKYEEGVFDDDAQTAYLLQE